MKREKNLDLAIDFLVSSIDQKTKGSAAFHSRIYFPFKKWSAPYPETTGYIIATLLDLAKYEKYNHLKKHAKEMADWIIELQAEDGGLPGGLYDSNGKMEKSIFNTAQMIIGLNAAYIFFNEKKYMEASAKAASWLKDVQEENGYWTKYHYQKDFFPSYYTRVAWPMLEAAKIIDDIDIENAALKTFDAIQSKKNKNKFVKDAGFKSGSYAFLHTIAYTIRGFLEGALINNREDYWITAYDWAYKLLRKYEIKKKLAGAYFEDFKEVDWYRCLTGEAQMVIIWMKIFEKTKDIRFVNASSKLLDEICKTQPQKNGLLLKAGGIKGSHPYHGRYIMFRQPNWATKFFIDALLLEEKAYQEIVNKVVV